MLEIKNADRPKNDPIYQSLRALEEINSLLIEEKEESSMFKLTATLLKIRYSLGFGLETHFQQIDLRSKVKKLRQNQDQLEGYVSRYLSAGDSDVEDDFKRHAAAKILDISKAMGALVTLYDYDFEMAIETLQNQKIIKAFNQGIFMKLSLKLLENFVVT